MIKELYGDEFVSRRLWFTALLLIGIGLIFTVVGTFKNHYALPFGILAVPGMLMIAGGFPTQIEADPPHVGLLKIWGQRLPVVIKAGLWFFANFFPFFITFILISVAVENHDFTFDVLCKAEKMKGDNEDEVKNSIGAIADVKFGITFVPDYRAKNAGYRLMQYLNVKRLVGLLTILTDIVKEKLRQAALDYSWEQLAELKDVLSASMIAILTEKKVAVLPLNPDGSIMSIVQLKAAGITPKTYEAKATAFHHRLLQEYVDAAGFSGGPKDEAKLEKLDADIHYFLETFVTAGLADVKGLGIFVTRFNMTHVFPTGLAKAAAEAAAAEKQERLKEERDTDTDILLAQKYVTASGQDGEPKMPFETALRIARINRGRAKEIQITGSSGNSLMDAAAIMKS